MLGICLLFGMFLIALGLSDLAQSLQPPLSVEEQLELKRQEQERQALRAECKRRKRPLGEVLACLFTMLGLIWALVGGFTSGGTRPALQAVPAKTPTLVATPASETKRDGSIIRYVGKDGRLYFTNLPLPQTLSVVAPGKTTKLPH
jgi:hypothetical protein